MSRLNMQTRDLTGVAVKIPRYLYERLKAKAAQINNARSWPSARTTSVARLILEAMDPDMAARYPYAGISRGDTVAIEHQPKRSGGGIGNRSGRTARPLGKR